MKRRSFILKGGAAGALAGLNWQTASAKIPAHNWDGYDFGPAPSITERLYQGPFSNYGPEAVAPGASVVMTTTPSKKVVPNYGMGLVTYICDEVGPPKVEGETLEESIEKLAKWPVGNKLYLRVDWRDVQKKPGKLEFPEHWKITFDMARKYNKRIGLRVQLMSPVIEGHSMPDYLVDKVPLVKLGTTDEIGIPNKVHYAPRYDHPAFMSAYKELDDLLSDAYNGHELVEYVDTFMYGFWGEGHSWPFPGNPFPDYPTAERTSIEMFEHQAANWTKTPLATNTQPDWSNVGNSEVLDRTIRSYNWLRTDTIFIENTQIEALSNRPPWIGATIENGITKGAAEGLRISEGVNRTDNIISHIKNVSPTYCSLWNWHDIRLENLTSYYEQFPDFIDDIALTVGYRVRPSWIWFFEKDEYPTLILGLVNDGIAGVPGALRVYIQSDDGTINVGGSLDPGHPLPGKVRQAQFVLPKGTSWEGLKVKAELEVKGVRYPIQWACFQDTNQDGSVTLRKNLN